MNGRILIGLLTAFPLTATAQWTLTELQPPLGVTSFANAVHAHAQYGQLEINGLAQAVSWNGTAGSWVSLHPGVAGVRSSAINAVDGGQQAGYVVLADTLLPHASVWSGDAGSWVDLHPLDPGFRESVALGVSAGQQVGHVTVLAPPAPAVTRACLWSGSAVSFVDLQPAGATESRARGVHEGVQVGQARIGGITRAGLWRGSGPTWTELHPAAASTSVALGVHGGQQVGYAGIGGVAHASLWRDTAESWIDLHPGAAAGAFSSLASAVHGSHQVGFISGANGAVAAIWSGSAATFQSLPSPPGGPHQSQAWGVWSDGETLYVVGVAIPSSGHPRAILWTRPESPPPDCYPNCDASTTTPILNVADFTCFLQRFAASESYANCDGSTTPPTLNVADFTCFLQRFAAGCP